MASPLRIRHLGTFCHATLLGNVCHMLRPDPFGFPDADEYAKELSRYIHLNPVRAGIVNRPEEYEWSSYRDYIGKSKSAWLTTDFILGYFDKHVTSGQKRYKQFTEDAIGREEISPLQATVASTLLGTDGFIKEITERYLEKKVNDRNLPAVRALNTGPVIDNILEVVNNVPFPDESIRKKVGIYLCHRYSGAKLKDIGSYFKMKDAAVSQTSKRFARQIEKDKAIRQALEKTEERLMVSYVET